MKKIPKRYRKPQYTQPTARLIGLKFKWNEKVWVVESHNNTHAFIRSGNITSQIELKMLPKVVSVVAA